ncbi:efflux RND transporter periplasmic adaptor subunit [Opitutaceae bacterium TAV4]|nr:efflux RND transporter periplasmic adaptor subunit [Opitutaceae bacterium TAV4]RRK02542.1 efflux RND transporter periplasmic adaptor subunit [Opitutaceae bacterium TAV3]
MKPRRLLVLLILLALAAIIAWRVTANPKSPTTPNSRPGAASAIPVHLATATRRDVPIWLTGIGTVQASNTVTVRPRVSGSLDQVNFTEGQTVTAGDILAQIDPRPYRATLEQARARKTQNEALLASARLDLARIRTLVESEAESRRLLEQQEAAVAQLAALVQADQAALEAAQLDLDFTTIRAPITGRTGVRLLDAGNIVTASQGAGLVVITQLQPVSILFTLPQTTLPALRPHMQPGATPLPAEAIADDTTRLAAGRLELIDNQIDTATGTLRLKATFPNDDLALWPGQFVSARILVDTRRAATVLPSPAVQPGLDGPYVYLVNPDDTVTPRPVRPGPTVDGFTIIDDGLAPGDRVILDGHNKLKPGSRIAVVENKPEAAQ